MNAIWIILTASLVSFCCSILGCFLVLRKISMIGDAISHAVLPGIVIAFFISGSLSSLGVLIGASLMGILCTMLIEFFDKKVKVQSDAAIGMIFTFLFAIGVILIAAFASNIHLDQDCVLHGEIAYVPLDLPETGTFMDIVPIQVWILSSVFLFLITVLYFGYKGLFLTTFDPEYATSIGISTIAWHYFLMALVSLTTVVSFESVGAILVVAFLIVPAATAYLLTDKLLTMIFLSCIIGLLSSVLGYYLAVYLDGSIAGAISVAMGFLFILALLFSPSNGLVMKSLRKKEIAG